MIKCIFYTKESSSGENPSIQLNINIYTHAIIRITLFLYGDFKGFYWIFYTPNYITVYTHAINIINFVNFVRD